MAVEVEYRRFGVGRAIINKLEEIARARGAARVVLNARDNVLGFYQRCGYKVIGPGPTMFDKVKHAKMEKLLQDGQ